MKPSGERYASWPLIAGIVLGVLALTAGPALAALTFSGTSISGDGAVVIDSSSTISIGTSTATAIRIGRSGQTVNLPGDLSIIGNATTTNLAITALGTSGAPCLTVNAVGTIATTTCGGGSSQWTTTSTGIFYNGGSVTIGSTVLTPANSVSANLFEGDSGTGSTVTTGIHEQIFGLGSGEALTTGIENEGFGWVVLPVLTTGNYNTAMGSGALYSIVTASNNTAFGADALNKATSSYNTAVGFGALQLLTGGSGTAVGRLALNAATTGTGNVAMGMNTAVSVTTGGNNTAIGDSALYTNVTQSNNTAVGQDALLVATTGNNTAVGSAALSGLTSGQKDTAIGMQAGVTAVGANQLTTGNYDTFLGFQAGPGSSAQQSYLTVIGSGATGTCSNCLVLGRTSDMVQIPNGIQFTNLYSVAGTALPVCASSTLLQHLAVSDATVATPGSNYAGSGTYTINVECIYNSSGSVYTWIID